VGDSNITTAQRLPHPLGNADTGIVGHHEHATASPLGDFIDGATLGLFVLGQPSPHLFAIIHGEVPHPSA